MARDAAGNLYVINGGNNTISKVTPTGTVSALVSNRSGWVSSNGMAFDRGNLYVTDSHTIFKVTRTGSVSAFVGYRAGFFSLDSLAFDAAGNLYVANFGNSTISKVTPAGAVSTFVSSGLDDPEGLAFDPAGDLYVANGGNNTISKVTPAGTVSTFAAITIDYPYSLAFDTAGNLYVADYFSNAIYKVTPAGTVSTFISSGLSGPNGLTVDAAGNVYVTNLEGNTISKITLSPVIEGQAFSGTVFHFTDADPFATASDYTAVVTLGDGNSVTLDSSGVDSGPAGAGGQIVADAGGGFDVQLSYTYAEAFSNQTFSVQVTAADGATTGASTSNFSVADAP